MNRRDKLIFLRNCGLLLAASLFVLVYQFLSKPTSDTETSFAGKDTVEVHFIDVGQGDSILIEAGSHSMLIDTGDSNKGAAVVNYLKAQDIKRLDYIVGTHPHSDHLGALDMVIRSFPIDKIILPDIVHTTENLNDVLATIADKQITILKAKAGDDYLLGPSSFTILAPQSHDYDELNNYSIVIKLTFGSNSFLFMGDAEKLSEDEILDQGTDLSADVLKLAHHGSSNSNPALLDAVKPTYAVLSADENNDFGDPLPAVLQELMDRNILLFRTDKQGTVVFTSDGRTVSVNTNNYMVTQEDLKEN